MNSLQVKLCKDDFENNQGGEISGKKCGEIYTKENEIRFNVLCTFCGMLLQDIEEFTLHFKINHIIQNEDDKGIKIEECPSNDILLKSIGHCKSEINYISDEEISEDKIEYIDILDLKTESVSLENIIERNIDSCSTIELVDGVIPLEEKSSNDLNKEPVKECNSSSKPKMNEGGRKAFSNVCNICNKVCRTEDILKNHIKCDHNPTYSFIDNLNNQSNSSDDIQEQEKRNPITAQPIEIDPLKCRYCDRRFKRRIYRFEHECLHTGEKPHKCTICEKTFRVKNTLRVHLRVHENKREFKCDVCGNGFNSSTNLRIHLRRHNNEKPHKCSYCDKRFVYSTEKLSHEKIHTGEKPFQCTECGQQYSTNSKLGVHFRKKHIPRTPVKCEKCDKTFMSKERLKMHQVVHNKDYRPFECDVCSATFQRRYAFSQHKKLHSDEFRYTCNICGKNFKQFAGLYSHKKVHGENSTK